MFIETEQTPNPESLKFMPGCQVMVMGSAEFYNKDEAINSPLALRLFGIEGVKSMFFGPDFITVTKTDDADWETLQLTLMGSIMEHFSNGEDVVTGEVANADTSAINEDDSDIVKQIKELLETRIKPVVAQDGGEIVFSKFEDGIVYLHMRGACSGCPSASITLKNGVEKLLKQFIPEVKEVKAAS